VRESLSGLFFVDFFDTLLLDIYTIDLIIVSSHNLAVKLLSVAKGLTETKYRWFMSSY
jgi:hypothetical protein